MCTRGREGRREGWREEKRLKTVFYESSHLEYFFGLLPLLTSCRHLKVSYITGSFLAKPHFLWIIIVSAVALWVSLVYTQSLLFVSCRPGFIHLFAVLGEHRATLQQPWPVTASVDVSRAHCAKCGPVYFPSKLPFLPKAMAGFQGYLTRYRTGARRYQQQRPPHTYVCVHSYPLCALASPEAQEGRKCLNYFQDGIQSSVQPSQTVPNLTGALGSLSPSLSYMYISSSPCYPFWKVFPTISPPSFSNFVSMLLCQ